MGDVSHHSMGDSLYQPFDVYTQMHWLCKIYISDDWYRLSSIEWLTTLPILTVMYLTIHTYLFFGTSIIYFHCLHNFQQISYKGPWMLSGQLNPTSCQQSWHKAHFTNTEGWSIFLFFISIFFYRDATVQLPIYAYFWNFCKFYHKFIYSCQLFLF